MKIIAENDSIKIELDVIIEVKQDLVSRTKEKVKTFIVQSLLNQAFEIGQIKIEDV